MKAGRRRGAGRRAGRRRGSDLARRRGGRRGRRRGAREPRRPGGAAPRAGRRGDRDRADGARSSSVAHKGFVWREIEVTGRAAHGSRPHLGVDAIVKAGPILTALGAARRALGEREPPAARARVGPRLGDRGRRRAVELPGALRHRARAPDAARARRPRRRGGARRAARPLPRRGPGARGDAADAARARAVRGRPRSTSSSARSREAAAEVLAAPAADRRRELLGRLRLHRRRRHPDGAVRPGRRGRPRRRGVGQPRRHGGGGARRSSGVAERFCA